MASMEIATGGGNYGKTLVDFGPNGLVLAAFNLDTRCTELRNLSLLHHADNPLIKHFLVSSCEVFCRVQAGAQKVFPRTVPQSKIASFSRMYRGILRELVTSFEEAADASSAQLYYNLEFVWHLCEIMFISSNPELPVLPYFAEWIHLNFDDSKVIFSQIEDEIPEMDSETMQKMWDLIYKLIFHGKTKEAAKYLKYMNPSNSPVIEEQSSHLAELLAKRPVYHPAVHSVTNFERAWNAWIEELERRLSHRAFLGHEEYTFICKIMLGDDAAFETAKAKISWYEYLGMTLTYKHPTARPGSLKALAKQVMSEYGFNDQSTITAMERVLLEAMDYNIVAVLRNMQLHWNHPWFALHFADLVYCSGRFSNVKDIELELSSVSLLRDEFITDHGSTLMQHPTMWQVGVRYLESIPERGGWPIIKEYVQRKKVETDFDAHKLISVAERFGFSVEIHGICKERALNKLRQGRKQDALLWSIKAGDGPLTTHILDMILLDGSCDIEQSLLECLRNAIACADRLLFLSGFCDFRKMMDAKDYRGAVAQLCHLIKENLIPARMADKLALNIQHFKDRNITFEPSQISTLMEFLHTKVDPKDLGEDMFRKLNSVLLCNRAEGVIRSLNSARQKLVK